MSTDPRLRRRVNQLLDEAAGLRHQAAQRAEVERPETISYWTGLADGIDHAVESLGLAPR
jgi:hypothetical protein